LKLAAGANLLSPFRAFAVHGRGVRETGLFCISPAIVTRIWRRRCVAAGAAEFESFSWQGEIADPQVDSTFANSRLKHVLAQEEPHRTLLALLSNAAPFSEGTRLGHAGAPTVKEFASSKALATLQDTGRSQLMMLFNFGDVGSRSG